jgi:hypothetical protein
MCTTESDIFYNNRSLSILEEQKFRFWEQQKFRYLGTTNLKPEQIDALCLEVKVMMIMMIR